MASSIIVNFVDKLSLSQSWISSVGKKTVCFYNSNLLFQNNKKHIVTGRNFFEWIFNLHCDVISIAQHNRKVHRLFPCGSVKNIILIPRSQRVMYSYKTHPQLTTIRFILTNKGGSRHKAQYYGERFLFFIRHFSNCFTLHRNALSA